MARKTGTDWLTRDPAAFTDKITASKKLRRYLDIEEKATCQKCVFRERCKLRDIEPESKVTSSGDVLKVVYMMAKQAQFKEKTPDVQSESKGGIGNEQKGSDSQNLTPEEEGELIRMESARQMKEFAEATNNPELIPQEPDTAEEELGLYISGIRLLDGLEIIVPKTQSQKEEILDMLEASIQEYTTRRKVDTLIRLQKTLDRTCAKSKIKRNPSKGIHELIDISSKNIEQFAKSPSGSEVKH